MAAHPLLGLTLAAAVLWLVWARRFRPIALEQVALAILAIGLIIGLALLVVGATTRHRLLVDAHVAVSAVGAAILVLGSWRTAPRLGSPGIAWLARAAIAGVLVAAAAAAIVGSGREARWRAAYRIENPSTAPATMDGEGAGTKIPFFPSSANTNVDGIIPATLHFSQPNPLIDWDDLPIRVPVTAEPWPAGRRTTRPAS